MTSKSSNVGVTMKSRVLKARVNVTSEGEATQSLTSERETIERMQTFSLQYGGMWQEFYEQLQAAKSRASDAELLLIQVVQERDLLRFEKEELSLKFKDNLLSLTQQESTHLEVTAILEQIREEKNYLMQRLTALEDHANYVEKLNRDLQGSVSHWQDKVHHEQDQCKGKDNQLLKQQEKVQYLEHEVQQRDRRIQELEETLLQQSQERKTLQKALDNKMKQCSQLMKEKNTLKEEYEALQMTIKTGHRSAHKPSVEGGTPITPTLSSRSITTRSTTPKNTKPTIPQSNKSIQDVKKTLFASPLKSQSTGEEMLPSTPNAVADIHDVISPSTIPLNTMKLQELVDEDNKSNPWCQPPSPSTSLRTSYRKASTPTQMRRRAAAATTSLSTSSLPIDSHL